MGRQIIKASSADDLYLEWSSVVEAATFVGDRAGVLAYLRGNDGNHHLSPSETHESRLARADRTGSSGLDSTACTWDTSGVIYMQRGLLPRSAFPEFARRLLAADDDDPDVSDLLVPFEEARWMRRSAARTGRRR